MTVLSPDVSCGCYDGGQACALRARGPMERGGGCWFGEGGRGGRGEGGSVCVVWAAAVYDELMARIPPLAVLRYRQRGRSWWLRSCACERAYHGEVCGVWCVVFGVWCVGSRSTAAAGVQWQGDAGRITDVSRAFRQRRLSGWGTVSARVDVRGS